MKGATKSNRLSIRIHQLARRIKVRMSRESTWQPTMYRAVDYTLPDWYQAGKRNAHRFAEYMRKRADVA